MTYTLKRIGFLSAVKIAAIISAAAAVLPIILLLLLNAVFKFLDIEIPPDVLGPLLAQTALLSQAVLGGVSTALTVSIYNVCAPIFGGITLELKAQRPPRKSQTRRRHRVMSWMNRARLSGMIGCYRQNIREICNHDDVVL